MTPKSSALGAMVVTIWRFSSSIGDSINNLTEAVDSPALLLSSRMHVLLQTAQVNVSIPRKELSHSLTVRAIFDTDEQGSYINQKVVNALKLGPVKAEGRTTATFGDQKQKLESDNLVELSVTKSGTDFNFKITLNAFAVPQICNDLQGQEMKWVHKKYPSLKDTEFADVRLLAVQWDLLIGPNYIWDLIDWISVRGKKVVPWLFLLKLDGRCQVKWKISRGRHL